MTFRTASSRTASPKTAPAGESRSEVARGTDRRTRAAGSDAGDPTTRIAEALRSALALRACWFESFPFDALLPRIEPGRIVVPAAEAGARSYSEWQPHDGIELPVRYRELTLGRFVLVPDAPTCGVALPSALRADAIALADSAGAELGRRWTTAHSELEH